MSNQSDQRDKIQQLSPLQRATFALKKLDNKLNSILYEPIAIIGMGCSFPGGATTPEKFWQLLQGGTSVREEIPVERWDINTYYYPNREAGKIITRYGHFIKEIDQFDPGFFGISPREATAIDPQHRLLLEVSWQALERAGHKVERLNAEPVGVFVGNDGHDYEQLMHEHLQQEPKSPLATYTGTGNSISSAAGRLAYTFGFTGPTLTIDTACSSSLVAIHQACNSIRLGECDMAIAGGVKLHLTPDNYIFTSRAGMISSDGLCKTFDSSADGYARGEGCGIIVLKRLSQAQADRDPILALIRGSAVNQNGPSSGLTVPNGQSQQKLIQQALKQARVEPAEISYLEAHGTGTSLGDPIEVNAAAAVLGQKRPPEKPLWIGSVKTNIGHLESAAGVSGLIKVVLSMQHQQLPAHLHLREPNPKIDWQPWLQVPKALVPWDAPKGRLAGVSSFGFTGTNAHVVLEEAPSAIVSPGREYERPVHLLQLSAKNDLALVELAQRYSDHLETHPEQNLGDICFTANSGRAVHHHRLAVVASNRDQLRNQIRDFSAGSQGIGVVSAQVSSQQSAKIAFLFTGQSSQYVNMGRQLYETQSVFRQTLDQCNLILQPYLKKSILDIIYPDLGNSDDISLINQTAYTQPALFAIEYALAQLWESWGIKPDVVMGHSVGEYVAATVAGIFSLEDGLKLIAHRGRLMQQLPKGGEMISVIASEEKVNQVIAPYQEKVVIAAINGPESIVISGESEALGKIQEILASEKIKTKQLQVSHAFHSPLMEPMLADFQAVANQITYNQPQITLISNVTGSRAGKSITTANYWVNHVRQPVKFAPSMKTLHQEGYEVFLEIGSQPILLGMGRQCLPEGIGAWLPSLRPSQEDWQQMLHSLAALYVRGFKVNWLGFDRYYVRSKVVLPTYPFQRQRYWIETSENVSKKAEPSSESKTTTIVDWLNDGNTQQLAQQLEKAGKFSPEQIKLLPEVLETLVKQHQEELTAVTIKDWFYQVQWKPLPESQPKTNIKPGHWLIFVDSTGVGEKLAEQWQQQGGECSLVYRGERYQKNESRAYELNPTEPQEFEQLIKSLRERSNLPLQRVIHLWSLDTPITKDLTVTSLESAQRWGCGTVLHLIKALSKTNNIAQLWLVTRGAQSVQSQTEEVSVAASSLWGMGRVISLEHPELWSRMVDLDLLSPESEIETLFEIIVDNNQPEDHLALRGEHTYIARLVKQSPTDSQPILLESNATYLITGGLGALGLHTAKCLVEKGAKHLVLTGRRQSSAFAQQTIEELQKVGVQVLVLRGDISQEEYTTNILDEIKTSLPPLRGVIHAAGLLDDGLLQNMTWEQFTQVMAPKIQGSWHLHNLTQNLSLDFFVCFSSIASLMGSLGQGNYAAANAFMDALVQHRQWMGLPGLSINWGPWAQVGMTANLSSRHQARMVTKGINTLDSEQGLQILGQLLGQSLPQVGVLSVEWSVFQKQFSFGNQMPLLLELVKLTESQEKAKPKATKQYDLLENLKSVPEADRYDLLRTHIQSEVAQILGIKDLQLLTPEQNLLNIGLDSLCAIELKTRLNSLGVKVSLETIQQGTSISELAQECVTQIKKNPLILNEQINLQQKQSRDIQKLSPSQDKKSPNNPMKASVGFETSNPWLVVLRANPDAPMKLICFPYAGAGPVMYSRWFEDLSANVEVYAVQLPGRAARLKEKPIAHMDRVVEELTPSLVSCIKDKPFAFFGHCIGALQMFEVTHQLQKDHCLHPDHMFVSGARAPQYYNQVQLEIDHQQWLSHNQTTHKSQEEKFLDLLRDLNFTSSQVLFDDEEMRQLMLPTVQADFRINDTYISTPKPPLEIPITAIGGQTDPFVSGQHLLGWKEHTTQDFTANFIPGDHYFIEKQRYYLTQLVSEKLNYSQLK